MRVKKKWLTAILCILCMMTVTGCAEKIEKVMGMLSFGEKAVEQSEASAAETESESEASAADDSTESVEVPEEEALSPEEAAILELENLYASKGLNVEEYRELAALYAQAGYQKKQRDLLEQSWRLYGDVQAYELLQQITVNILEENDEMQGMADLLMQNLDLEEYRNEALSLVYGQDWFRAMMPALREGYRTYYYEKPENGEFLVWRTGYHASGTQYTDAWYLRGETVILL